MVRSSVGLRRRAKEVKGHVMTSLRTSAMALALLGSAAFLTTPSFAVEPDVDSPAGPELPAPRYDRPDFQFDDQAGAPLERDIEGMDIGERPVVILPEEPDIVDEPEIVIVPD